MKTKWFSVLLVLAVLFGSTGFYPGQAKEFPEATAFSVEIPKDTAWLIPATKDSLGNLDPQLTNVTKAPQNGAYKIIPANGSILYIPNAGFTGVDVIEFQVCNEIGCDSNIINVIVVEDNNLTPIYGIDGGLVYPLFPDSSTNTLSIISGDLESFCGMRVPFIDPETEGDMDDATNHARTDAVSFQGKLCAQVFSVWAGVEPREEPEDAGIQNLFGYYLITNKTTGEVVDGDGFSELNDPYIDGVLAYFVELEPPVTGQRYEIEIVAFVRQVFCHNGVGLSTSKAEVVAPLGEVKGIKTDQHDKPVPGITINLYRKLPKETDFTLFKTTVTDINGAYVFSKLVGGDYYVEEVLKQGTKPIDPPDGVSQVFTINKEQLRHEINFVNFVLYRLYLPIVAKPPPQECTRLATITYIDNHGNPQTAQLVFHPGKADKQSIGTVPYGTRIVVRMDDGQEVDFAVLQYVDKDGGHYKYPKDIGLGPQWSFFGAYPWDEDKAGPDDFFVLVLNIYSLVIDYYENDLFCRGAVEYQYDPPEEENEVELSKLARIR
jgi:hypothetical protein